MPLVPPLERGFLVGRALGDMDRARDRNVHRVEGPAPRLDLPAELGDLREDLLRERMLAEQHVVAAFDDLTD